MLQKIKLWVYKWRCKSQTAVNFQRAGEQKIALVTVVKNEAPFLEEWINYHLNLGVDKIFIIDNYSTDEIAETLHPFIKSGRVALRKTAQKAMSTYLQSEEIHRQISILKKMGRWHWVGVFDADEYLCLQPEKGEENNLQAYLKTYQNKPVGALLFSWYMFGTSQVKKLDPKKLLVEQLVYRAPENHREHHQFKPLIYVPNYVRMYKTPHVPLVKNGAKLFYSDGQTYVHGVRHITHKNAWLNHYWYRSEEYYHNQKKNKRKVFETNTRTKAVEEWHHEACNKEFDNRILQLIKRA